MSSQLPQLRHCVLLNGVVEVCHPQFHMTVSYITFEVALQDSVPEMTQLIETSLRSQGMVLGWCVIDADLQQQTLTVVGALQQ